MMRSSLSHPRVLSHIPRSAHEHIFSRPMHLHIETTTTTVVETRHRNGANTWAHIRPQPLPQRGQMRWMYVAILWALPTPRVLFTVGSPWELLSHPVGNWEQRKLLFQVSKSKFRCECFSGSELFKTLVLSLLSDLVWAPQLCTLLNLECSLCFERVQCHCFCEHISSCGPLFPRALPQVSKKSNHKQGYVSWVIDVHQWKIRKLIIVVDLLITTSDNDNSKNCVFLLFKNVRRPTQNLINTPYVLSWRPYMAHPVHNSIAII